MGKRKGHFTSQKATKMKQRRAEATPEERDNLRENNKMQKRQQSGE